MAVVSLFDSIAIPAPREEIFRRLGYKKGRTQILSEQRDEIDGFIDDAVSDIHLKGAAVRIPIVEKRGIQTFLASGQIIHSARLAALLTYSEEVLLIGATAGHQIMHRILEDSACNQMTRAIVLDATASEMTDGALDWIVRYFNHILSREGRRLTKNRYSAGYGDFPLENQAWIYAALELNRLDIALTEAFILVPEKSVTAISGIERANRADNE